MNPTEAHDEARAALLGRVHRVLADGPGEHDDEILRAFHEVPPLAVEVPSDGGSRSADVRERIERLPDVVADHLAVPTGSRLPGGSTAHRLLAATTRRQTDALLTETRHLAHQVSGILGDLAVPGADSGGTPLERTNAQVDALADALVELDGRLSEVAGRLDGIETSLERLESTRRDGGFDPWFAARDFDEEFRGSRSSILDRYHDLADILARTGGPVADLGCGRGEMVELLMARGVTAWGAEVSPELVEFCRSISLDVRLLNAHEALESVEDGALGGVVLIQVVEHLTPQQLVDTMPLLARKVRPGGVVVAETVNATSPYVFTRSFYLDPTHHNPIHPSYLAFLFRHAGFADVDVQWRSLVPESEQLPTVRPSGSSVEADELATQVNAGFHVVNQLIFGAQDYAVVATR